MVSTGLAGGETTDHDDSAIVIFGCETISQSQSELAGSERQMGGLIVHGSYTLLQSQQRLIDFGPFYSPLPIVALGVLSSLAARQIHQQQFA